MPITYLLICRINKKSFEIIVEEILDCKCFAKKHWDLRNSHIKLYKKLLFLKKPFQKKWKTKNCL